MPRQRIRFPLKLSGILPTPGCCLSLGRHLLLALYPEYQISEFNLNGDPFDARPSTCEDNMRLLLTALIGFSSVSMSLADMITFEVNLSATSDLGNNLTVFGLLKVDPTLPIDNSNIGAQNLFVQRNSGNTARSLSFMSLAIPNDTLGTVQMEWSLTGSNLYVSRTSSRTHRSHGSD